MLNESSNKPRRQTLRPNKSRDIAQELRSQISGHTPDPCYKLTSWIWMMPELINTDATLEKRQDVFEVVVKPHLPRLYRFCLALTTQADLADDLFQNALIKAYTKFDSFSAKGELASWLCGIARNEHQELRRTNTRRSALLERVMQVWTHVYGGIPGAGQGPTSPDASVDLQESHSLLLKCLEHITVEHREIIVLCDIEALPYEEIATMLSIPLGTVKSRHARAHANLRNVTKRLGLSLEDVVLEETIT